MNPLLLIGDWVKAGVLTLGVTLTGVFQPYEDFTREVDINQPLTLVQKVDAFDEDILQKHLTSEDVFLYELPHNLGDQCIWNGVHVAYRAIRYGHTQEPKDLVQLKRFMKALRLLQTHPETGETLLLRGRVPLAEYRGSHGGYRQIHQNDTMIWQEDASGDSFVGHVYALAMAFKYGDEEVKNDALHMAVSLYKIVKDNKYHLLNADGSRTKFSKVGPGFLSSPARVNGLVLLAKLIEVGSFYGEINFLGDLEKEYHKLAIRQNQIKVAANSFVMGLTIMKYPNMNLVKMTLHGLIELEENEKRRNKYIKGLRRGWRALKVNGDVILTALLNEYYPKRIKQKHLDAANTVMHEFSTNHKIGTEVDLTDDTDIRHVKWGKKSRPYKAIQPYPVWRQAAKDYYWQRDPHDLYDHRGCKTNCKKFSGLDFLIAYYIGKTYNIFND